MVSITVVSPIHNEEDVVEELIQRVQKALNRYSTWEYILTDDWSTDRSPELIQAAAAKDSHIRYLRLPQKGGQTGCFKAGFDAATGDIVITMDGDLQVLPEDLPLFIDKMEQGYDIVNGIREHRKHDFWLRFASRTYNLLMLLFFNCPVIDAASNYTAFKAELVRGLPLTNNDHRYIIPIAVRRGAKVIGEVVVQHRDRKGGKSKYKVGKKFLHGGPEIIKAWLRYKRGRYDLKKETPQKMEE